MYFSYAVIRNYFCFAQRHAEEAWIPLKQDPYYLELRFGAYVPESGERDVSRMEEKANVARKSLNRKFAGQCVFYDRAYGQSIMKEKELVDILEKALENR